MNKCKQCSEEYEAKRSTSTYCSDKCRKLAFQGTEDSVPSVSVPTVSKNAKNEMVPCEEDVKSLSKDDLYDAISCYQQDDWVSSPEFEELKRRLNKWDYKKLEEEGYKIPAWLYHKHNKNLNAR